MEKRSQDSKPVFYLHDEFDEFDDLLKFDDLSKENQASKSLSPTDDQWPLMAFTTKKRKLESANEQGPSNEFGINALINRQMSKRKAYELATPAEYIDKKPDL